MVFRSGGFLCEKYCKTCYEKYISIMDKWCKQCQISNLKAKFTKWTSENEKIDDLIQEIQLKINDYNDIIFEWIPYKYYIIIIINF